MPAHALLLLLASLGAHPLAAPGVTSLTDGAVRYTTPAEHHVTLRRGDVTAVIVDNAAVDAPDVPGHRAGYNGVAVLKHVRRPENLFVPAYAGLNLEHIHDGTAVPGRDLFEPRSAPMQLRVVDTHTVELYQPPTPVSHLESCGRYRLLDDGVIEYTFECVAREDCFKNGYIGLFWASYIHQPESLDIHFRGRLAGGAGEGDWIRGVTPRHGVDSNHPPAGPLPDLVHDEKFPLALVFSRSKYVYTEPWYYGVSHGMAYAPMFRARDRIWLAQSPSGGGSGNPAWDFQWFIPDYKVGEAYGFVMRTAYLPFTDAVQVQRDNQVHRNQLNPP